MVSDTQVKNAASALARAFPLSTSGQSAGKLYEAWLMLEIGLTLRNFGWQVTWIDPSYTRPSTMRFRGGPGSLYSRTGVAPGYLSLIKDNKHFIEIHNSVRFRGFSDTLHEVDISVIYESVAKVCRRKNVHPRGLPKMALELKHYTGDLGLGLTRSMLLASNDLAQERSFSQRSGRSFQMSRNKSRTAVGNLDKSLVRVLTTAKRVGRSKILADFYGPQVIAQMMIPSTYVLGSHDDVVDLCWEFDAMFP
ncbi:hypothetical protein RI570_06565 [Brucella pseudogrignonensis]|uniref:hypothetical protein n=1 Tax=Brucella pseudogrignonensis TaxID=419475 RepID=UPI0028B36C1D|nr:hypothetical protein [Brucella pseudogrignonensis]MDT6939806.1 hypothetical protein [Brucella pseudogrignonensis]